MKNNKLARLIIAVLVLVMLVSCAPEGNSKGSGSTVFTPKIIHGVEVYGINEKINTYNDILALYAQIDRQFELENDIRIKDKVKQRKELLDPNERYLEIPVWQSAYDSFEAREDETGVDFPMWIKMHVDAMNMCFENAKPSSNMRAVLRRIIVIQDSATNRIWSEKAFKRGRSYDLNVYYRVHFKDYLEALPLDTDTPWAMEVDYRPHDAKDTFNGGIWFMANSVDGYIEFSNPQVSPDQVRKFSYLDEQNSLSGKQGVWMDFGLTHEWLHYLFNLPDEYTFDISMNGNTQMFFSTGSFGEPWLSPYLSMLSQNQIDKKLRESDLEGYGVGYSFQDVPPEVNIYSDQDISDLGVRIVRVNARNEVSFPRRDDLSSDGTLIKVGRSLMQKDKSHVMLLDFKYQGSYMSLYMPYAGFDMSQMAGEQCPLYRFEVLQPVNMKAQQFLALVDGSEIDSRVADYASRANMKLVARMNVAGTNSWYLWFQYN